MSHASAVESLLFAALEIKTASERAAFLDSACAGAAELRRQVEKLLKAHAEVGDFLNNPVVEQLAAVPNPEPAEFAPADPNATTAPEAARCPGQEGLGTVIADRYTLVNVIGEGGMGSVYRAEQTQPVKRQVALKLIKSGMDSKAVLARFDAERQALGLMDHPSIARVFDGGTTASGQPFFVMELVQGVPLTEYCDQKRLSLKARLELFVQVCHAVQHAHQKGIIHRDLKPGNVLVTEVDGRPTPKVIDFGVAKATELKLTDLSFADVGVVVGTPAYMSPEQADPASMDIDTRTDVYALGVILYELLTGSPPIDARQCKRGAILEMLRLVREVDPPRPSTRVSTADALPGIAANRGVEPAQLKGALRGDLDWIVMMALEKDRTRRYETANGFAADVLRHLAYEPVLAAPPSRAYRFRKFLRKNRTGVIAAGLVLLALVVGFVGMSLGLLEAVKARQKEYLRAEGEKKERERAELAEDAAKKKSEEIEYRLNVSEFVVARTAYENNDLRLTVKQLNRVPPEQRGWEWQYLTRLTRGGIFTLNGNTGQVNSVSFSPDGTRIVTASGGGFFNKPGVTKVWDALTGTPLFDLKGNTGAVTSVSFSPDGTRIVTASEDRTAKVWDARTGTRLLELKGHTSRVNSASFSPDGTRIVSASSDRTAKVWDARTGTPLIDLKGHTFGITSVSFSPDGTRIVTASADQAAKVWDARTGTPLIEVKGHTGIVNSVSFSPEGTRIVTGGTDGIAKVWDARTGTLLLDLRGNAGMVNSVSFSPDGTRIVTGSLENTAKVWDARTGTPLLDLNGHTGSVKSVSFSPDGTRIVTGSYDQTARIWDARTGTPQLDFKAHILAVNSVSFSPDGTRIVTGGMDQTAKVWDARTGAPLLELKGHPGPVNSVSFSPDGTRVVTASGGRFQSKSGVTKVWDARTGAPLLELKGHTEPVMSVSFSPDGTRIVTGSGDQTAKVWDALTGTPLLDLKGHTRSVNSVSFSLDGTRIVTGSGDQTAKVWDARTGTPLVDLKGHTSSVTSVSFSPDGTRIVTASEDQTAKVWDAAKGEDVLTLRGHSGRVTSVAFSADGQRILTGSIDNTAKVWDVRTGTPLLDLKAHTGMVNSTPFSLKGYSSGLMSVSFSPDGTRIVAGSAEGTTKVWEARTGSPALSLKFQTDLKLAVSFSPDGTRVFTRFPDGTTKVWDAKTGTEVKGESVPETIATNTTSPDGRLIIRRYGDRLELIPVQPEGEELAYRRFHMRPNLQLYREGYVAARAANDDFLTRFYFKLLAPAEQKLLAAQAAAVKKQYRAATALYAEAFAADSGMADALQASALQADALPASHRYSAAGTAALAAAGQGEDVATLDSERSRLRKQALDWLRAELNLRTGQWEGVPDADLVWYIPTLKQWQSDAALSALRDPVPLAKLPIEERTACSRLWADVDQQLTRARGRLRTSYEKKLRTEPENARLAGQLANLVLEASAVEWTVLKPLEMKSKAGATLELQPDGSVLASGVNASGDVYTISALSHLDRIAAVRLEALPDPTLPNGGPGRHSSGNFQLSAVRLHHPAKEGGGGVTMLPLEAAWASFDYKALNADVAGLIDESRKQVWHVWGRFGLPHEAIFLVRKTAAASKGRPLAIELRHQDFAEGINLGRFRLSVSGDPAAFVRERRRLTAMQLTDPWTKLAMAYLVVGDQQALAGLLQRHPAAAAGFGDLYAAEQDWERAIAEYLKALTALTDPKAASGLSVKLVLAYQGAGRTREAVPHLAKASAANPADLALCLQAAALQAWFGQEKEFAATRQQILAFAKNTNKGDVADCAAKVCSILPSKEKADLEAALTLGRTGVKVAPNRDWNYLALGMAEYRSGNDAAAEEALLAATKAATRPGQENPLLVGAAAFYRGMSLFRQGKKDEARKLASEAAAKMKPLPKDENNPVSDGTTHDDLILWLAYKEAKAVIQFDAVPPLPKAENDKK